MPGSTYDAANLVMDMEPELASAWSEREEQRPRWPREDSAYDYDYE